jgi:hypothetical protein
MIRSIHRRLEALEKIYPKPSAGELANKKLAARLRSLGLKHLLKDLNSTEMDDEQIAAFELSHASDFLRVGVLPKGFFTEQEMGFC